jgi:hypothetical protein
MSTITRDNYYDFAAISNSALGYALPECGGSYTKFTAFMNGEIHKEETDEMKLGTLIHAYLENPGGFTLNVIETKPSEAVCKIIKDVFDRMDTRPELKDYPKEIVNAARAFGYQPKWKDDTVATKIITEGTEYFNKLASPGVIVDKALADKITAICFAIQKQHPLLVDDVSFELENGKDWKILREAPFTWREGDIDYKILIDRLEVNDKTKQIRFTDYKTTSTPLSLYTGYKTKNVEGEDEIVHGSLIKYHVHRQIRFYERGLSIQFPGYEIKGQVLAVEVNAPYESKLIDISKKPEYIEHANYLITKALKNVEEFYAKELSL